MIKNVYLITFYAFKTSSSVTEINKNILVITYINIIKFEFERFKNNTKRMLFINIQ